MQQSVQLKGAPLLEVKPIERRANCKIVQTNGKSFLVGGMTAEAISNQVYEFRLNYEYQPPKLEWKQVHFQNNLFSPRNSFAACAAKGSIYVWGGLQFQGTDQKALSDLIQMNVITGKMRQIQLKNKIKIHSAALLFDEVNSMLIGYGGSDQNANFPAYLYKLKLEEGAKELEWEQISINCQQHQGYIWQHSANFSHHSYFTGQQGSFLTVVGGCRLPHVPYNAIIEINMQTNKVTNNLSLQNGLVSHDSVQKSGRLYIFGGSKGGDFNSTIYVLNKGLISKLKGHRAIGCSCCLVKDGKIIVYGGVCGQTSINGAFIYE